jgi:formamidopyrimidine-DNA glycosylase
MPELPEVETTRRGISPFIEHQKITAVTVRNYQLRWPIPDNITEILTGQRILSISRRAKYLVLQCDAGNLLIHLGMSGSLRILNCEIAIEKHDHVDFQFENGYTLRYNDPRRFGAILWTTESVTAHTLIKHLGPEPLSELFCADYLISQLKRKKTSIKTAIMNGKVVVGVGNIYASEALFLAGIHPKTEAQKLSFSQCEILVAKIKYVLEMAISAGGTTLKDFTNSDGKPGYFSQQLNVYGRHNQACYQCGTLIESYKDAQRTTYCCPLCQI